MPTPIQPAMAGSPRSAALAPRRGKAPIASVWQRTTLLLWVMPPRAGRRVIELTPPLPPTSSCLVPFAMRAPFRLGVAADDFVIVGDATRGGSAVYRIDPTFTTNQLLLGPVGNTAGLAAGSHGTIESRPIVTGSIANGNMVLYDVDGDLDLNGPNGAHINSIQVYKIGAGPLPWMNAPTYTGGEVGVDLNSTGLGGNEYPGLTMGTNGLIYASNYRLSPPTPPLVQVWDPTGSNNLWNSWQPDGTAWPGGSFNGGDYFEIAIAGQIQGVADSAVP